MSLTAVINERLDHLVRPALKIGSREVSSFHVCGVTGLALAVALALALTTLRGLPLEVMMLVSAAAVATFLGLAMLTKIVTGGEKLVYYHHEIAVLLVSAGLLALLRQPVLAYLDATLLGVGAFLACGRVGCLMVGCCYGRPSAWGVCYRHDHVEAGFPAHYAGARLLPVQALEAAWVALAVTGGSLLVFAGRPPGSGLVYYLLVYSLGRFVFEFLRGDAARPYRAGFSEAQWTSLATAAILLLAGQAGWLPLAPWQAFLAAGLLLAAALLAVRRRLSPNPADALLSARHIDELARRLRNVQPNGPVQVFTTSHGLQISTGITTALLGSLSVYTLSAPRHALTLPAARRLAGVIRLVMHPGAPWDLFSRQPGIYHLLIAPPCDPVDAGKLPAATFMGLETRVRSTGNR